MWVEFLWSAMLEVMQRVLSPRRRSESCWVEVLRTSTFVMILLAVGLLMAGTLNGGRVGQQCDPRRSSGVGDFIRTDRGVDGRSIRVR